MSIAAAASRHRGPPACPAAGRPLFVADAVEADLLRFARTAYPDECCGMLGGTAGEGGAVAVGEALPAPNRSPDSSRSFEIGPEDVAAAERRFSSRGEALVGFFHSHPAGWAAPSLQDLAWAGGWSGFIHCIVGLGAGGEGTLGWFETDEAGWVELQARKGTPS